MAYYHIRSAEKLIQLIFFATIPNALRARFAGPDFTFQGVAVLGIIFKNSLDILSIYLPESGWAVVENFIIEFYTVFLPQSGSGTVEKVIIEFTYLGEVMV